MNDEYEKTEKPPVEEWAMGEPEVEPEQPVGTDNFDITLVGGNAPTAAAVTEDWAMNVPDTNPAAEKAPDSWEMPPPVFRISSGRKMDKDNRKTPPQPPADSSPVEVPTVEVQTSEIVETVSPNLGIQPQPFISEEFSVSEAVAETPVKAKRTTSKLILLIIGLLAMILFAIAFVVGIYFLFFHTPDV